MGVPSPATLHHTCFAVHDVVRTARALSDSLGIGPWNVWTLSPDDCRVHGKPSTFSFRLALATIGGGSYELVSPHTGPSVYGAHLERHGEGFHHTCLVYSSLEDMRKAKAALVGEGREILQEGRGGDAFEFAYVVFPEMGSPAELLYLDAARLPPPELAV